MTEFRKMISGQLYDAGDPELKAMRLKARQLLARFNAGDPADETARLAVLRELLGRMGEGCWIEPPFYCDYGVNITLGEKVYMNFNCVILDPGPVVIGDNVMFGPAVQVYTATHPVQAAERLKGPELGLAVTIRDNAWIGGGAILGPGITVGENSVVAAGAVVVKNVPADVVVGGNPARIIKEL